MVEKQTSNNVWLTPYSAKRLFFKLNDGKRSFAFTIRSKISVRHYNSGNRL